MAPAPIYVRHAPVIQGSFAGSRLRIAVRHHQAGAAQLSLQGSAMQLPPSVLSFRPSGVGQRLPESVQKKMESLFGADFSDVRVHVGPEASSIGALAFTYGSDLYFAHGQYDPHSPHGHRLLGHELTHVLQQRAGRVRNPFGSGVAVVQDPGLEAEAERMGVRAAMETGSRQDAGSREAPVQRLQNPAQASIQRAPDPKDVQKLEKIADEIRKLVAKQIQAELKEFQEETPQSKNPGPLLKSGQLQAKPCQTSGRWAATGVIQKLGGNHLPPYDDYDCQICLGAQTGRIISLSCHPQHTFHWGCVTPWLRQRPTCPTCRAPIPVLPPGTYVDNLYLFRDNVRDRALVQLHHAQNILNRPRHLMLLFLVGYLYCFGILDETQALVLALGILFFGDDFIRQLLELFQQYLAMMARIGR